MLRSCKLRKGLWLHTCFLLPPPLPRGFFLGGFGSPNRQIFCPSSPNWPLPTSWPDLVSPTDFCPQKCKMSNILPLSQFWLLFNCNCIRKLCFTVKTPSLLKFCCREGIFDLSDSYDSIPDASTHLTPQNCPQMYVSPQKKKKKKERKRKRKRKKMWKNI